MHEAHHAPHLFQAQRKPACPCILQTFAHTASEEQPWFLVDLRAPHFIDSVRFFKPRALLLAYPSPLSPTRYPPHILAPCAHDSTQLAILSLPLAILWDSLPIDLPSRLAASLHHSAASRPFRFDFGIGMEPSSTSETFISRLRTTPILCGLPGEDKVLRHSLSQLPPLRHSSYITAPLGNIK